MMRELFAPVVPEGDLARKIGGSSSNPNQPGVDAVSTSKPRDIPESPISPEELAYLYMESICQQNLWEMEERLRAAGRLKGDNNSQESGNPSSEASDQGDRSHAESDDEFAGMVFDIDDISDDAQTPITLTGKKSPS